MKWIAASLQLHAATKTTIRLPRTRPGALLDGGVTATCRAQTVGSVPPLPPVATTPDAEKGRNLRAAPFPAASRTGRRSASTLQGTFRRLERRGGRDARLRLAHDVGDAERAVRE